MRATRIADRRGSFRAGVLRNANQQRSKAANYGHLILPRGMSIFKEEAGSRAVSLDILPYFVTDPRHPDRDEEFGLAVEGSLWYRRPYKMHRQIGVGNATVICPGGAGLKCPICEYRAKLLNDGANWKDKEISALRGSDRNLYYVSIKGSNKYEAEKPYLWDISQFAFQKLLNEELEQNEEFGDFPDLEVGLTLRIRFREEKVETNSFIETSKIDFDERDYVYDEALVRGLDSLDDVPDLKEYKEIEQLFFEVDGGEERAEPTDPQQGTKRTLTSSRERSIAQTVTKHPSRSVEPSHPSITHPRSEPERRVVTSQVSGHEPIESEDNDPPFDVEEAPATAPRRKTSRRESEPDLAVRQRPVPQSDSAPTRRSTPSVANGGTNECPSGHRFGVDVDQFPECEGCRKWNECYDVKEAAA